MEACIRQNEHVEDEEEYVLLDLDGVCGQTDIPPDTPYVLSIGEYQETIGTCFVFSESDNTPVVHEETGPSEANLFMGKCIVNTNQALSKQVKPVARLHKILKFRFPREGDIQTTTAKAD
eukprot:TRINITY_DN19663_c0_g1_i2.p1 TRINITY_DN19663_c0_g1~~TRINITY_DN19663_c0_g1_i2.p1  ORF type:complete len:120 (+),score=21.86 TRINITY_DN19663_c0_g1_i2:99-458(+)